ncbi:hypothetical protein M0805_003823 [Coniferiporia weirii]|nr:hypothetical protein M0805_003823 [Coniferiporia weirii]
MWYLDVRLTHFMPGLLVPISSYPALVAALLLLFVSIYTLTFTAPAYRTPCALLRLALAPPTIALFWNFGFNLSYNPPGAQVAVGMAVIALYGIMRVLDASVITLLDTRPSQWMLSENGKPLPLPSNTKERLAYTLDLLMSLRGTSWFANHHWEWAPRALVHAPTAQISRRVFLRNSAISLFGQYLLMDGLDALNKSRIWNTDTTQRHPITSLPLPAQLVFSLSVCTGTMLSITIMHTIVASGAIALGSAPSSWPPMFDRPFAACSLADFWARRWHAIFRRIFARLSLLVLLPIPIAYVYTRIAVRALGIFLLSATLHVLLMYRLELVRPSGSLLQTVLDRSILAFFLAQPLGLALEALLVTPLAQTVLPNGKWVDAVTRAWAWCFLLWAGRFWSDVWVRRGMWGENEHVVGYSIVRGLLWGKWRV